MPEIEVADSEVIAGFIREHRFLSNFYHGSEPVRWDGRKWPTAEHAFQAAKCTDQDDIEAIFRCSDPGDAKRLGRRAQTDIATWERIKDAKMLGILRSKFKPPGLRSSLIRTESALLVEGNTWHDNYWGVCFCRSCSGRGQNMLGRLLMVVRSEVTDAG